MAVRDEVPNGGEADGGIFRLERVVCVQKRCSEGWGKGEKGLKKKGGEKCAGRTGVKGRSEPCRRGRR